MWNAARVPHPSLESALPLIVRRAHRGPCVATTGRRSASFLAALLLVAAITPASALAATPLISTTLTVSPVAALDGQTMVTWTGVVTPVSGTPTNVGLTMQSNWWQLSAGSSFVPYLGSCQPALYCTVASNGDPSWTFPTLSVPRTITYETVANTDKTTYLYITSDGVGCQTGCPSTAKLPLPKLNATIAVASATGDVPSGTNLHVTVTGTSTASPLSADLHASLSDGLETPTNIDPPSAVFSPPPSNSIDDVGDLSPAPSTMTFDTVVSAANGTTVSITAHIYPTDSKYGVFTISKTIHVGSDKVAPTTTAPKQTLASGTSISSGRLPVRLAWTASDAGSGVANSDVAQSTDGGAYATVWNGSASALNRYLSSGHTYRFRVRSRDTAGNVGAWVAGASFKVTGVQQSSAAVRYAGTWATSTSSTWWGGSTKSSSKAGSTTSYTFTGRSIAWVGVRASNRGKARVYVNGTLVVTIDLYAATTSRQRIVWSANYSASATRTLRIQVLGTSGRPRVDVDGLIVAR